MTISLRKLAIELTAAGIPFVGLSNIGPGDPDNPSDLVPDAIIQYASSATSQQRTQGNAIKAASDGTMPLGLVSCLTIGPKVIGIVGRNGSAFLPQFWRLFIRLAQGVTQVPTISMGTNGPNYDNLLAATALTNWSVGQIQNTFLSGRQNAVLAPTPIYINVTVAAVATQYVIGGQFEGDYLDL